MGGLVEGRGLQQVGLSDNLITLPSPPHPDLLVPPWPTDYLTIALLFYHSIIWHCNTKKQRWMLLLSHFGGSSAIIPKNRELLQFIVQR